MDIDAINRFCTHYPGDAVNVLTGQLVGSYDAYDDGRIGSICIGWAATDDRERFAREPGAYIVPDLCDMSVGLAYAGREFADASNAGFDEVCERAVTMLASCPGWVYGDERARAAIRGMTHVLYGPDARQATTIGELALARTLGSGEDLRRRVLEGSDDPGLGNLLGWIDAVATSPFVIGETWGDGHEFGDDGAEYVYTTFATPRDLVQYDNLDNDAWEDVLTDAEDTLAAATAMCAATAYTCAGLTPEEVSMWVGANTSLSLLEKRVNDLSRRITGPTCEIELNPRRGSHFSL